MAHSYMQINYSQIFWSQHPHLSHTVRQWWIDLTAYQGTQTVPLTALFSIFLFENFIGICVTLYDTFSLWHPLKVLVWLCIKLFQLRFCNILILKFHILNVISDLDQCISGIWLHGEHRFFLIYADISV